MTLVVVRALGLITLQDLGRPGRMHEAVPAGGALVPSRLVAANRAVGNPDGAVALEVQGVITVRVEAAPGAALGAVPGAAIEVATDSAPAQRLAPGSELTVTSEPRRVAYLAVRGGIEAPLVLGGRGALLCAGLGGLVRAGERIERAGLARSVASTDDRVRSPDKGDLDAELPIRVIPGPDGAAFAPGALETLTSAAYRVLPTSDRVGTRLDGPPLARTGAPEVSRPMVIGAIEVPADGRPIVLGPEHPTTGGYPVIAVVAHAELDRLFSIRIGGAVRFAR